MHVAPRRFRARTPSSQTRRPRHLIPRPPESLEARDVPAAGALGINLASMGYVDVMNEPNGQWQPDGVPTLTLDARGYPTADANITVLDERVNQPWNGPDPNAVPPDIGGTYHLTFHGQATIQPPDWLRIFTIQNQVYNASTNVTTADVVVVHNPLPILQLNFVSTRNPESPTGAGISEVHLLQPGYPLGTSQLFTNDFLNALRPFGTLRYLVPIETNSFGPQNNNDGPLEWSRRRLPNAATQNDDAHGGVFGEAWEYMVALANATNTNMWITVPSTATNDYVTQLANLIKNGDTVAGVTYAGLNPGLKVYLEYSNEVWGGLYNTYASNINAAVAEVQAGNSPLNNDGVNDRIIWANRHYLERTMQIGNIFRSVFGGDSNFNTIRPVLGWQEQNWQYYTDYFPWFQSTFGAPSQSFYGMGDAIYWGPTDISSSDAIINSMAALEASTFASMQKFEAVASYYGLKYVSYEGGPSLSGTGVPDATNALAASRDPRMESLVYQHYLDFYKAGGDVATYFSGPYSIWAPQYGIWPAAELAQASNPSQSAKYRALLDIANAPTQAATVGIPVSATVPTSLPVNSDALGHTFTHPFTNDNNYWLLSVATAGNYNLQLTTGVNGDFASKYIAGRVEVRLANQQSLGTFGVNQAGTFGLGVVPLHAGLNVLVIHTVHGAFDPLDPSYGYRYEYDPTSLTILPVVQASTIGGPGTSETGTWSHLATYDETGPGNASATASFTYVVTPGVYRVSASWNSQSYYSAAVPYTILDGLNVVATVPVNQKQPPSGFVEGGTTWQDLGTSFTVLGNALTIREANAPDGAASAKSIRIEQVRPLNSPQILNDNSDLQFATTGTWYHIGDNLYDPGGSGYVTDPANGPGTATWTLPITPGLYKISTIWPGGSIFSGAATYSLFDQSNLIATVPVNQRVASAGYNDGSVNWQELGGPYVLSGNTLTIRLASASDGRVEAQAIRIQQVPSVSVSAAATANFTGTDSTTQGSWRSGFGADGYNISQDHSAANPVLPSYASLAVNGASNFTWSPSTSDPAGLQNAANNGRLAACWYSGSAVGNSFDIAVNVSGTQAHRVSIYTADIQTGNARSERFDVIDAASGAVLDSRTIGGFQGGRYLSWSIRGNVIIRATNLVAGLNAVVGGVFFGDAPSVPSGTSVSFAGADTTTQGSWRSGFGADGYNISQDHSAANPVLPSYASLAVNGASNFTWSPSTSDPAGLQNAANNGRLAACWYSGSAVGSSFEFAVNVSGSQAHKVTVFAADFLSNNSRVQRFDVIDAVNGAVLDSRTISGFQGGQYLSWNVQGSVIIRATNLVAGLNAVVGGVFFGDASVTSSGTSVSFTGANTTTQGNWRSVFGADGYNISQDRSAANPVLPSYASLAVNGASNFTWSPSTSDLAGLQNAANNGRLAACWYSGSDIGNSFDIAVNVSGSQARKVSIYAADFQTGNARAERFDVIDAVTGAVLDRQTIRSFQGGEYLSWNIRGNVIIRVTNLVPGLNSVVGGVFFG